MKKLSDSERILSASCSGESEDGVKHIGDRKTCLCLFGLALLLCLPLVLWNKNLPNDSATFYSPMIREFADGNYGRAFFPLFPPLFIIVGGLFAKLGFAPFTAAKLASTLFFSLTVFPIFSLGNMLWDRRTALWAVILFLFCDKTLEYAGAGLLDTGKIFFLTTTVYALIRAWRIWDWFSLWALAAGAAGLALVRGEGVFFSLLALMGVMATGVCRKGPWSQKLRLLPILLAVAIALSPWVAYEWKTTGYPVTDSRQIEPIKQVLRKLGLHKDQVISPKPATTLSDQGQNNSIGTPIPRLKRTTGELLIEIGRGFYPSYAILALIGIGLRVRRRLWRPEEWLLLGVILGHTAFLIVVIHIMTFAPLQKRYIIAVLPLMLGWTVSGFTGLDEFLRKHVPWSAKQKFRISLLAILGTILLWDGYNELHHSAAKKLEHEIERDCAHWLTTQGLQYVREDSLRLDSTSLVYHNGRLPILLTVEPQIPFWAGADLVFPSKSIRYSLTGFLSLCEENSIHFVVWDRKLVERCPELENLEKLPASLAIVYDRWRQGKYATVLLAYRPHTQPVSLSPLKTEGPQ